MKVYLMTPIVVPMAGSGSLQIFEISTLSVNPCGSSKCDVYCVSLWCFESGPYTVLNTHIPHYTGVSQGGNGIQN